MVFITVSAGYTCAAALAGAATVAELSRAGRSVLEILGFRKPMTLLHTAERSFNCHLWVGFTWRPCVLSMAGDLLMLSGRCVEEARLMESAHVSVQDFYASVALLVGDPLQLCFGSPEEAESFATEVRSRAALKKDMMKLADQAKDLRENLSSGTLSSDRSRLSRLSRQAEARAAAKLALHEAHLAQVALRHRLSVPKGVPMYTLSPSASGDLEKLDKMPGRTITPTSFNIASQQLSRESSTNSFLKVETKAESQPTVPASSFHVPSLELSRQSSKSSKAESQAERQPSSLHRASSCPSPSKLQKQPGSSGSLGPARPRRFSLGCDGDDGQGRPVLRRGAEHSAQEELSTSPRDPESFASKVFMGLGLDSAKASLVAQKRVDVLKTKFEAKGSSSQLS